MVTSRVKKLLAGGVLLIIAAGALLRQFSRRRGDNIYQVSVPPSGEATLSTDVEATEPGDRLAEIEKRLRDLENKLHIGCPPLGAMSSIFGRGADRRTLRDEHDALVVERAALIAAMAPDPPGEDDAIHGADDPL
jgi:hypothetical protein